MSTWTAWLTKWLIWILTEQQTFHSDGQERNKKSITSQWFWKARETQPGGIDISNKNGEIKEKSNPKCLSNYGNQATAIFFIFFKRLLFGKENPKWRGWKRRNILERYTGAAPGLYRCVLRGKGANCVFSQGFIAWKWGTETRRCRNKENY